MKIHKLWNSGRAEPSSGSGAITTRAAAKTGRDAAERTANTNVSSGVAAAESAAKAAVAWGAGAAASRVQLEHGDGREGGGSAGADNELAREPAQRRASLESTVAGVAGLPQEVLRRIIGYCTL